MNLVALHGNIGSTADFDFLPTVTAVDLWRYSHLSLTEAAIQIDGATQSDLPRGVIGYSMGGRLALHLLTVNPSGWDFAVIVSAHPGLSDLRERKLRIDQDKQWAETVRSAEWRAFLEKWNDQPVLGSSPVSAQQLKLETERQAIAKAFENWSLGNQEDLSAGLNGFKKPLIWVVGEQDEKFVTIAKKTAGKFVNHSVEVIADCGHRLLVDAPDEVSRVVEVGRGTLQS